MNEKHPPEDDDEREDGERDDRDGDDDAAHVGDAGPATLFNFFYDEIHRLAAYFMNRQAPHHTMQPTDLINEAFLKLANRDRGRWDSKQHFMGEAARTMRSVLVDHARSKGRDKRTPPGRRVALDGIVKSVEGEVGPLDAFHKCVERIRTESDRGPLHAFLIDMKLVFLMTTPEIAAILDMPERTVERRWKEARALLRMCLK